MTQTKQTFRLIHRQFAVHGEQLDLGGVQVCGHRLTIKLTLQGQSWFENRTDAFCRDVRKVIRRLASHSSTFGIWDEDSGLGLERV